MWRRRVAVRFLHACPAALMFILRPGPRGLAKLAGVRGRVQRRAVRLAAGPCRVFFGGPCAGPRFWGCWSALCVRLWAAALAVRPGSRPSLGPAVDVRSWREPRPPWWVIPRGLATHVSLRLRRYPSLPLRNIEPGAPIIEAAVEPPVGGHRRRVSIDGALRHPVANGLGRIRSAPLLRVAKPPFAWGDGRCAPASCLVVIRLVVRRRPSRRL